MTTATAYIPVPPPKEAVPYPETTAPLRLAGIDHIAVVFPDLPAAEAWYVDVLGATIRERYNWGGDAARRLPPHSDLLIGDLLFQCFHGDPSSIMTSYDPRLVKGPPAHKAFHCRDMEEIDAWRGHLERKGVDNWLGGHIDNPVVSIYFDDPWGYPLEIATQCNDWPSARAEVARRGGRFLTVDAEGIPRIVDSLDNE